MAYEYCRMCEASFHDAPTLADCAEGWRLCPACGGANDVSEIEIRARFDEVEETLARITPLVDGFFPHASGAPAVEDAPGLPDPLTERVAGALWRAITQTAAWGAAGDLTRRAYLRAAADAIKTVNDLTRLDNKGESP